jgi:hypothetical protein
MTLRSFTVWQTALYSSILGRLGSLRCHLRSCTLGATRPVAATAS